MRTGWLLPLVVLAAAPSWADTRYRDVDHPKADVYYGHISYCELQADALDPLVLRDAASERAIVNFPLTAGDTIATSTERRCEAQFDTGTLLRLDRSTSVRIETILARAVTSGDKLTNLQLHLGRLRVMYRNYNDEEVFQVLTANAAVKLGKGAVVDVRFDLNGTTHVAVERGAASVLYGPRAEKTDQRRLKAGERASVEANDTFALQAPQPSAARDAFDQWNEDVNRRFVELHDGRSELPKPINNYPLAVINFAQNWSSAYGEWIWSELYGYVWRPYLASHEGWHPYAMGSWVGVYGRRFWVPEEPWGWVPYHLGLWHWDKKAGWVWIPGSAFAPAWVMWSPCGGGFRPYGLWDWTAGLGGPGRGLGYGGYGYPYGYGYGYGFGAGYGYDAQCRPYQYPTQSVTVLNVTPQPNPTPSPAPSAAPSPAPEPQRPAHILQLPSELRKVAERYAEAARKGEVNAFQTAEKVQSVAGTADPLPQRLPSLLDNVLPRGRFRDWNHDVKAARERGGQLGFSRADNKFECLGCRIAFPTNNTASSAQGNSNGTGSSSTSSSAGSTSTGSADVSTGQGARGSTDRDRIR